jgi:hypothetical protein
MVEALGAPVDGDDDGDLHVERRLPGYGPAPGYDRSVPTLRGIDDRRLTLRAWLREQSGVLLRKLRVRADPVELPAPPFLEMTLRARSAGKAETTLRVDADYGFERYAERRALYTDFLTGFLVPRTTIWSGDHLMIAVNALGCRGEDVSGDQPVIAFFGDSTTLGVIGTASGLQGDSWPAHVAVAGYDVLNAGVEGLQMDSVARRYQSLRERVPLACAVFYTGWHNIMYNRRTVDYWEDCLQSYLSEAHITAICTLPSPLLPEMRERGITPLLNEDADVGITDDYFNFWGDWDPEVWLRELLDVHERYNDYVVAFCRRTAAHLIDLRGLLYPDSYEDAPRDFFDVCHVRPRVYEKIGAFMSSELTRILPDTPPSVAEWRPPAEPAPAPVLEDVRRNIYPIW